MRRPCRKTTLPLGKRTSSSWPAASWIMSAGRARKSRTFSRDARARRKSRWEGLVDSSLTEEP
jgi:hypothetical protein